jgi:rhamnose utilization protein RhaD (predicted bifunctional aldolase and dehydrogenase)
MESLVHLSKEFGGDPRYVIAGGGNSSLKEGHTMYVKASGSRMSAISPEGFVAMDLEALNRIWEKEYPADPELREEAVLADLMSAKRPGEEKKRPSVETLLHSLFTDRYVMHTHPALVNGLTCGREGAVAARELFGPHTVWIPVIEPGYVLAKAVRDAMLKSGTSPSIVFLQNHGVFITGSSEEEIRERYGELFEALETRVRKSPVLKMEAVKGNFEELKTQVEMAYAEAGEMEIHILPFMNAVLGSFIKDHPSFSVFEQPFTPDHIVYAGFRPLFVESFSSLTSVLLSYKETYGELPKVIALRERGCFACASGEAASADARDLFIDAARVAVYTESFGGAQPMPNNLVSFIRTWEAEKYRQKK